MSEFINATYDGKPCLLNMDYVMDIFPKGEHYEAYTIDFDRGAYAISKAGFDELRINGSYQRFVPATDFLQRWFEE